MSTTTTSSDCLITTAFLDSLPNLNCGCFGRFTCPLCRAMESDQAAEAIAVFGADHLRNFIQMREQKATQLTECAELLTYASNKPELMKLLEDINLSPHTTEHGSNDRVRMNRIIQAWRDRKFNLKK